MFQNSRMGWQFFYYLTSFFMLLHKASLIYFFSPSFNNSALVSRCGKEFASADRNCNSHTQPGLQANNQKPILSGSNGKKKRKRNKNQASSLGRDGRAECKLRRKDVPTGCLDCKKKSLMQLLQGQDKVSGRFYFT